jgi:hypothetical protein
MAEREGVYYLETYRAFHEYPIPVVLYLGKEPMRIRDWIKSEHMSFRFRLIDIRELDGDALAEHGSLGDAMIAILATVRSEHKAIRRVLDRIAKLKDKERELAVEQLAILAGLRDLEIEIIKEARRYMPFVIDLMENKVFRNAYERGTEAGMAEGRARGLAEGKAEGMAQGMAEGMAQGKMEGGLEEGRRLLLRQLEKRFGNVPPSVRTKVAQANLNEIESWSLRLLEAATLEDAVS